MWAIIKFDKKQFEFLKRDFNKQLGKNFIIYSPKFSIQKYNGYMRLVRLRRRGGPAFFWPQNHVKLIR